DLPQVLLIGAEDELIAVLVRDDPRARAPRLDRRQVLAQRRDTRVQVKLAAAAPVLPPQAVDQCGDRYHPVALQGQQGGQCTQPLLPDVGLRTACYRDLNGAQQTDLQ